ncbi:MAG TPA: hypothetical protein VK402_14195 [Blastococcus sp.]|nr:hypothetical protein [Blastococcus sp.]
MSVFLPAPVPLDLPPGSPDGVGDLARVVASAAFRLALLDGHLAGPAAWAPGWLGDDAGAAVAQLGRLAQLVRDASSALDTVAGRLAEHSEALESARAFVRSLQEHQEADFSVAEYRLARLVDPAAQMSSVTEDPQAVAVVDELEAAEAGRRRQHTAVLEEVAADAARTAAVLADASSVVGGTGQRGDEIRAVVHLATLLPGWGDRELATRGRDLAGELLAMPSMEERQSLARDAAPFVTRPAFAGALLAGLGEDGIRDALSLLGDTPVAEGREMARLVAAAFGAAEPGASPGDPVDAALHAVYVDPDDPEREADLIAMGLAAVLASGAASHTGGPRPETVVGWARQMLARERMQAAGAAGPRAVDRAYGGSDDDRPTDPLARVVENLVDCEDPSFAAGLMRDREAWEGLLSRPWDDAGAGLTELVARAGADGGSAGDAAVRAGLASVGGGLFEGDPADRTVNRDLVDVVAPALGEAVAAHLPVVTSALTAVAHEPLPDGTGDLVRGLGYLTVDTTAAAAITASLRDWALVQPHDLSGTSAVAPLRAVAVPSTFVAVRQYGQRLAHALDCFEDKAAAELRQFRWDATAGLASNVVPGLVGVGAGALEGYLAIWWDMDGTWDDRVDRRPVLDAGDAARAAFDGLTAEESVQANAVSQQARAAYERASEVLGRPKAPVSPEHDYWEPATGGLSDLAEDRLTRDKQAPRRPRVSWLSLVR